ncbi:MAG: beta-lactamase family protein [Chloroflexi bacterium]|nr:beta-lactamase family protein [Chloroflexota bacterium]
MNMTEVADRLQAAVEAGHVLGLSLAVVQNGAIVFNHGYGRTAADETGSPVTPDTLFAYGSIGKTICATLVLRLVEHGLLDLDRPLASYLPRLAFSDETAGKRLTLRHVLSHTTGLPAAGREYGPQGPGLLQQVIEDEIPHYPFLAEPGVLHFYSNTAFCLAGYAAEVVAGAPYDQLVREWVFEPLDMAGVTFAPPGANTGRLALPHEATNEALRPITRLPANDAGHPSSFAYGTARDLAHLALVHLEQGHFQGRPFLAPRLLAEMHRQQASRHIAGVAHPLAYLSSGYGLGLMTGYYHGQRVLRHGGMTLSYNCFFELLPDERAGFVLLTNASEEDPLMELVAFLYDQLLGRPHRGPVPVPALEPYTDGEETARWPLYEGAYLNVEWGAMVEVRRSGAELLLDREGEELALTAIAPGRYVAALPSGSRLPVAFLDNGVTPAGHMVLAGEPYQRFEKAALSVEPAGLAAFAGSYRDPYNTNAAEMLHLEIVDGRLCLREGDGEALACEPLGGLAYRCELGFFELRNAADDTGPLLVWGRATRYRRVS